MQKSPDIPLGSGVIRETEQLPRRDIFPHLNLPVVAMLAAMILGLLLWYGSRHALLALAGLLLFGGLAALRPAVALLLVPISLPLFLLTPAGQWNRSLEIPPYELTLWLTTAGSLPQISIRGRQFVRQLQQEQLPWSRIRHYWPEILFVVAGLVGLWSALPDPEAQAAAQHAFATFIIEPLVFALLIRLHYRRSALLVPVVGLVAAGSLAGLIAIVQFAVADGGRSSSVYNNPNNLGLFLGRIWPIAVALALLASHHRHPRLIWLAAGCAAICVGGLVASLSRGAWMGMGVALVILLLPWIRQRFRWRILPIVLTGGIALLGMLGLMFWLRGGVLGGSAQARLLLWYEALIWIWRHPFGLGLDQFYFYHYPGYGRSVLDPALYGRLDQTARQPHNALLEIWLNLGPLGVLAFGGFALRVLQQLRTTQLPPTDWLTLGIIAALAGALTHGMVDSFYFWPDLALTFWLLLAILPTSEAHANSVPDSVATAAHTAHSAPKSRR